MKLLYLNVIILVVWLTVCIHIRSKKDDGIVLLKMIDYLWLNLTIPIAGAICNFMGFTYFSDKAYIVVSLVYLFFTLITLCSQWMIVELDKKR